MKSIGSMRHEDFAIGEAFWATVAEVVFDEDDIAGCYRTEADLRAAQGD
jgi:hypothetical protein